MSDIQIETTRDIDADVLLRRYRRARDRRGLWESHWRECYEYALPGREAVLGTPSPGEKKGARLYDGTAVDAVDQLSASLLSELTPPWSRWFDFKPGPEIPEEARPRIAEVLDDTATALQGHFDRGNFAVEMHQCYLDLVTAGTASLMFEEAPIGERSAFRFTAVPLGELVVEESLSGQLDTTFRRLSLTPAQFRERYPKAELPDGIADNNESTVTTDIRIAVIEAVLPGKRGYDFYAVREGSGMGDGADGAGEIVDTGTFRSSPFITFRWVKAPGEIYGRSPVMKALPDIKTANKVVELVLKNASIAVTGIWQADDDGVLNPANIKLEPGTIIPKAVGSAGLQPLIPANDMNLSDLVLERMQARIRHALLIDLLGQPDKSNMTATEVAQRSHEMARLMGAIYGRLQSELLTPLAMRAISILQRRGEIPAFEIDSRSVELVYTSPLARLRTEREAKLIQEWIAGLGALGPQASGLVDPVKAARHLAKAYGVPEDILKSADDLAGNTVPDPGVGGMLEGLMSGGADGAPSITLDDIMGAIGDMTKSMGAAAQPQPETADVRN